MNNRFDRRDFLKHLTLRLVGIAPLAVLSAIVWRYMSLPFNIQIQRKIPLGFVKEFPGNIQIIRKHGIALVNNENQFQAVSLTCTHLGCTMSRSGTGFICPCHGSRFDSSGKVLAGPANRPLEKFAVQVTTDKRIVVDLGQPEEKV